MPLITAWYEDDPDTMILAYSSPCIKVIRSTAARLLRNFRATKRQVYTSRAGNKRMPMAEWHVFPAWQFNEEFNNPLVIRLWKAEVIELEG